MSDVSHREIPISNVKIYNYFEFRYKVNLFSFI